MQGMVLISGHDIGLILVALIVWGAALQDMRTNTIPNIYPLLVTIMWLPVGVAAIYQGLGAQQLAMQGVGGIIVLGLGIAAFVTGLMGGGDVKLLAAQAPLIPFFDLLHLFAFISLAGLVWALMVGSYGYVLERRAGVSHQFSIAHIRKMDLPYGPAIATGLTIYLALTIG